MLQLMSFDGQKEKEILIRVTRLRAPASLWRRPTAPTLGANQRVCMRVETTLGLSHALWLQNRRTTDNVAIRVLTQALKNRSSSS